jgi:hydroxymethylglutaryl-CoA reductase (NADPH)
MSTGMPNAPSPRNVDSGDEPRRRLERAGFKLDAVAGRVPVTAWAGCREQIENFVGLACIPIGVVGPLRVVGAHACGDVYVPMATTEGALIASCNRGAKIVSASGGARAVCVAERVSRAPVFVFGTVNEAVLFSQWVEGRIDALRDAASTATRHGRLESVEATIVGNQVHLDCGFTAGDAAGQNIVTFAAEAICRQILATTPVPPRAWFLEGNLSGDKKATARSFVTARGRRVCAEVVVPRPVVVEVARTTPERMVEYARVATIGAIQGGAMGVQGHYANALAAIFVACGQDVACVAEAAVGITRFELDAGGDLYVSVTLPNLIVGSVGGGTDLPTQRECLVLLGCAGAGRAGRFAEITAATVLAGEISLVAALAAGHFAAAHARYGRRAGATPSAEAARTSAQAAGRPS